MDKLIITQQQGFIISFICWILIRTITIFFSTKEKKEFWEGIMIHLFAIYICYLISRVLFPILLQFGNNIMFEAPHIWINPVESYKNVIAVNGSEFATKHALGNLILLSPMTFFLLVLYNKNFDTIKNILLISFIIGFSIEGMQLIESLVIPGVARTIDINDLIFNTLSGVWGYALFKVFIILGRVFMWMKKKIVL